MKSIIATLVLSVLILTLTIMGIELWRNNLEIISMTSQKVSEMEKIKESDLLPINKDQLTGGEVISIIRYYSINPEVEVVVTMGGVSKNYILEGYQYNEFNIPFDMKFKKQIHYDGKMVKKVIFTSI